MKNIINTVIKKTNGVNTLVFLFLQFFIYYVFNAFIEPTFEKFSNGFTTPDLGKFYKPIFINNLFENTNTDGWHYYLTRFAVLDFFYPAIYAISFALLIGYIYQKANKSNQLIRILIFVPFITATVDYCENFSVLYLIYTRPQVLEIVTYLLSFFTGFKVIGISLSIVIVLVGLIKWLIISFQIKSKS